MNLHQSHWMDVSQSEKEVMAEVLRLAICGAVCDGSKQAKKWLLLTGFDSQDVSEPVRGGFIDCCRSLGLNWIQLHYDLREALKITSDESSAALKILSGQKRGCSLS